VEPGNGSVVANVEEDTARADTDEDPLAADVLLVEDNEADVRLVREAFESFGRDVGVVSHGTRAVELLERLGDPRDGPRVVLLDLDLPGRSGFEVLRTLRNHPTLRHLPVVVFSNSRADEDVACAYEADANAYVAKPSELDDVIESMEAVDRFWVQAARLYPGES